MKKRKKGGRGLNILLNLLIVVCAGVLIYSVSRIVLIQQEYGKAEGEYEDIQKEVNLTDNRGLLEDLKSAALELDLKDKMQTLAGRNQDFVAWIEIPGTNIGYPVVQGSDNDYYLKHTFEGVYNSSGAIFMDYASSPDFSDGNTIIYGHNMHNGTMFENLNLLLDGSVLAQNSMVYVVTQDEILAYEIFAARKTDIHDDAYLRGFGSGEELQAYFNTIAPGVGLTADDKVLTLSTCTYQAQSDERVVVQAVLVERQPLE